MEENVTATKSGAYSGDGGISSGLRRVLTTAPAPASSVFRRAKTSIAGSIAQPNSETGPILGLDNAGLSAHHSTGPLGNGRESDADGQTEAGVKTGNSRSC